ncbi:hypothetical protein M409DRAFT_48933 [Zasmidium cellare ATCC 36951]|uniref:Uncharacterized protein n=1 Tax=Zasmidium cellare ATCC 36951 TaxID=1080233 RepID=A0A6A6D4Q3_ZASCE|nr:uncharacterized protein M409DRAFT_48933 [Zasmidium cellare ATCC 36951]KAF2174045.1 hypothetical protein M409DRAFT_48933 [Zasmidium cellare ATCC 36951]
MDTTSAAYKRNISCVENTSLHSLSTMQAERIRIAAEMNLRKEAHSRSPSLRRKLLHIRVLSSLEEMCLEDEPASPPPTYHDAVESFDEPEQIDDTSDACDLGVDGETGSESDEDDEPSDHEWSSDEDPLSGDESEDEDEDEGKDGHALIRIISHPSDADGLDAQHWAQLVSEATAKQGNDSPVIASVVEVKDDDD